METTNITFGRQHILEASYNELRKMAKGKIEMGRNPKLDLLRNNLLEVADKEEKEAQKELARRAKKAADEMLLAQAIQNAEKSEEKRMAKLAKSTPIIEEAGALANTPTPTTLKVVKTETKAAKEGTTNIGSLVVGDTFKFPSADKIYTILETKEEKGVPTVKVQNDKGTAYWMRNPNELNRQVISLGK